MMGSAWEHWAWCELVYVRDMYCQVMWEPIIISLYDCAGIGPFVNTGIKDLIPKPEKVKIIVQSICIQVIWSPAEWF